MNASGTNLCPWIDVHVLNCNGCVDLRKIKQKIAFDKMHIHDVNSQ